MSAHVYAVGQIYHPGRTAWPEIAQFNYRAGSFELILFYRGPTKREVAAIDRGQADFASYHDGDLLLLLYRFGDAIPWSDAPYSWHLVPDDQRTAPEPVGSAEPHQLLSIVLVDAANGLIRAMRSVTWSPAFTVAMRAAVLAQIDRPWPGDIEYQGQLNNLYARYPTTLALLEVSQSRTRGGR